MSGVRGERHRATPCLNPTRHPELVSGSTPPIARRNGGKSQPRRKVMPVWVSALDQVDFPLAVPSFELLLAQNGWFHLVEPFKVDELVDIVETGEAAGSTFAVLPQSANEVRRNADVKRATRLACKNVDARLAFVPHEPVVAESWTLKQVQGDGDVAVSEASLAELPARHAALVSASLRPNVAAVRGARWTLKRVQGDEASEGQP